MGFKSIIIDIINSIKWKKSLVCSASEQLKSVLDYEDLGHVLYIVPHADDELLSGYCLLNNYSSSITVYYCGMTGGNDDVHNKEKRDNEIRLFCKENNLRCLFPVDWKQELARVIKESGIKSIFLPSFVDWHNEHRSITQVILNQYETWDVDCYYYFYSVTVPIVCPNCLYVPMSDKEQKNKYEAFKKYYKSQSNLPIKRFIIQERINARSNNCYASELFLKVGITDMKNVIRIDNEQLNELKFVINNIPMIRKKAQILYNIIFENK